MCLLCFENDFLTIGHVPFRFENSCLDIVQVRHGSVGSTPARCKAGPSSNPDSAPQGGVCH
jgi:hypothetical protein